MRLRQYAGWTVEEVVRRNSHDLSALHLLEAREEFVRLEEVHTAEIESLRATLADVQRIGLAVLRARREGRKVVRIEDLAR